MTPLFHPVLFAKTLTVTICVAIVGCAAALRLTGELALRDIIGTAISALIFSYMVHLWWALSKEEQARE
jgi:uncharacterized membrane protein YccC